MDQGDNGGVFDEAQSAALQVIDLEAQQFGEEEEFIRHRESPESINVQARRSPRFSLLSGPFWNAPTFSCCSIITMTQSWWTWQQKKRVPPRLHERCSRIIVVQDFAKPYSRASHARGALLAQPELMTLDQAGRMTAAEIAGNRVVRVTRPGIIERTGLASAGRRIQGGERFSEIG